MITRVVHPHSTCFEPFFCLLAPINTPTPALVLVLRTRLTYVLPVFQPFESRTSRDSFRVLASTFFEASYALTSTAVSDCTRSNSGTWHHVTHERFTYPRVFHNDTSITTAVYTGVNARKRDTAKVVRHKVVHQITPGYVSFFSLLLCTSRAHERLTVPPAGNTPVSAITLIAHRAKPLRPVERKVGFIASKQVGGERRSASQTRLVRGSSKPWCERKEGHQGPCIALKVVGVVLRVGYLLLRMCQQSKYQHGFVFDFDNPHRVISTSDLTCK